MTRTVRRQAGSVLGRHGRYNLAKHNRCFCTSREWVLAGSYGAARPGQGWFVYHSRTQPLSMELRAKQFLSTPNSMMRQGRDREAGSKLTLLSGCSQTSAHTAHLGCTYSQSVHTPRYIVFGATSQVDSATAFQMESAPLSNLPTISLRMRIIYRELVSHADRAQQLQVASLGKLQEPQKALGASFRNTKWDMTS
jgi:hypothetical protein